MQWTADGTLLIAGACIPSNQTNIQSFLSRIIVENPTEIQHAFIQMSKIYPNPAVNEIKLDDVSFNEGFSIFDLNGKVVLTGRIEKSGIRIDELPNGIYLLSKNSSSFRNSVKFIINR
jgi:hypothetical protein